MIRDLHTHSIKSDDGRAKVENYCQWIRSKGMPLDGFVLTEHRQHDLESDYSSLAEKHGLVTGSYTYPPLQSHSLLELAVLSSHVAHISLTIYL